MNPTLRDLRTALEEEAVRGPLPSADALVAGAARRVQATRRRRAGLTAAVAVVVLVAGLVTSTHVGRRSSEPAHPGPFRVVASGGEFPAYNNGDKRLLVVTAPALEKLKGTLEVPTTPGRRLTMRMICRPVTITDWESRMAGEATGPDGRGQKTFCGMAGSAMGATELGVSERGRTPVDLDVFINHAGFTPGSGPSFKDASVSVAFYESVPWRDYHFPARPGDIATNPDLQWPPTPGALAVRGPAQPSEANTPITVRVPFRTQLTISLEVHGPGRLKLALNGLPVDFGRGGWGMASDAEGYAEFFDYVNNGDGVDIDPQSAFGKQVLARGTPLRVTVTPDGFVGPDWRVVVAPPG